MRILPSNLLIARRRGKYILPIYSYFKEHELYIAYELIEIFENGIGLDRKSIELSIKKLEDFSTEIGCNYRFIRGLAHILFRRAVFHRPNATVDPEKIKMEIFLTTSRIFNGFVLNRDEREEVLRRVADRLNITVKEVLEAFKTSGKEVLSSFEKISPKKLLKAYNLSLTQTLLFKAANVMAYLETSGTKAKIILFNVKRLGLMYTAEKFLNGIKLHIDGPLSVIRQTERYGTRLAKVLPYLISSKRWKISANIKRYDKNLLFYLSDSYSKLFPRIEVKYEEYDSSVEELFYKRFQTLGSGWKVEREPEPLIAGRSIFIPDFSFTKGGTKIYMEIVGFWTKEYIERKIKKLRKLSNLKMILAINKRLACSGILELPFKDIILYKDKLSAPEVYLKLKKYERKVSKVKIEEPINISPKVNEYLSKIKLVKLSKVIMDLKKFGLNERTVLRILRDRNFKIIWKGININEAMVKNEKQ